MSTGVMPDHTRHRDASHGWEWSNTTR